MGLAVGTAKYLLFFFNFIFFVTGIVIIAVGGVTLKSLGKLDEQLQGGLTSPAVLLIVVGVFVTIISFFGCCGAIRHSYCMLVTFTVLLALIFILELAAGIAAYVKREKLEGDLKSEFYKSLNSSNNSSREWWDELQKNEKCCGVVNSTDWVNRWNDVPASCCNTTAAHEAHNCTIYYDTGCLNKLEDYFFKNIVLIGGIGVGIAFIQILGIVYACCLASAVKGMS